MEDHQRDTDSKSLLKGDCHPFHMRVFDSLANWPQVCRWEMPWRPPIIGDFSRIYCARAGSSSRGQQSALRRWWCPHKHCQKAVRICCFFPDPPCSLPGHHCRAMPLVCRGPFSDQGKEMAYNSVPHPQAQHLLYLVPVIANSNCLSLTII